MLNSLDFLYIALGGGFVILVIFLCLMLLNLTILLRDISKITENVRVVSDKIKKTVLEPFNAVSEITEMFGDVIHGIRSKFESGQQSEEEGDDIKKKSKKGAFKIRRMKK